MNQTDRSPEMHLNAPARSMGEVLVMLDMVSQHGINIDLALRGTGINRTLLTDLRQRLSLRQQVKLQDNCELLAPQLPLALLVGQRLRLIHYGIAGGALRDAANLREAVELINRFAPLFNITYKLKLHLQNGDRLRLELIDIHLLGSAASRRFCLELELAKIIALLRDALGANLLVHSATLSTAAYGPALHDGQYVRALGCLPVFQEPCTSVDLTWSPGRGPARGKSPYFHRCCLLSCERMMTEIARVLHGAWTRQARQNRRCVPQRIKNRRSQGFSGIGHAARRKRRSGRLGRMAVLRPDGDRARPRCRHQ